MRARHTEHLDSWLLVAATAVFVLSAERYFQESGPIRSGPPQDHRNNEANSPETSPAGAAMQRGHGRRAKSPFAIPWPGWKDIFWRTYQRIDDDRLLATAGGVVFFGLLAIFPAVTALVSSYGLFADPSTISSNLHSLAMMLPEGAFQIVEDQVARVVSHGNTALGVTFLFGLLLAIWSANAGVKAIFDALNVAYEEREKRGFIRLNTVSLAFTVGGIAALLLMVGTVVAFPLALDHLGIAPESKLIVALGRWPVLFVILLAALAVLYRFGTQPRRAALAMAEPRCGDGRHPLDRRLGAPVLVSLGIRQLQRDLRLARRGDRLDDVDVDVGDRHHVRGRAELGDRTADPSGYDHRAAQAARHPAGRLGRHGRRRRTILIAGGQAGARPDRITTAIQRLLITASRYSLCTTTVPSSARLNSPSSAMRSRRSAAWPVSSSAANAFSIGP